MPSAAEIAALVAQTLEGATTHTVPGQADTHVVDGRRRGFAVHFSCAWAARVRTWHAEVRADGPPLLLTAGRRPAGVDGVVASGAVRAVPTGDAGFDARWLVEAAPPGTARQLVDDRVRAALDAAGAVDLLVDEGRVLVAHDPTHLSRGDDPTDAVRVVEAAVVVAERLGVLARDGLGDGASDDVRRQIAALRALRESTMARATPWQRVGIVVLAAGLLFAVGGYVWGLVGGLFGH